MKWLNKTRLPEPSIRTRALGSDGAPLVDASLQAGDDDAEHTEKWAVPDEIAEEGTPASNEGPSLRKADRHLCTTVASRIPAMLAESMGLAEEENPVGQPTGTTKGIPANRR